MKILRKNTSQIEAQSIKSFLQSHDIEVKLIGEHSYDTISTNRIVIWVSEQDLKVADELLLDKEKDNV